MNKLIITCFLVIFSQSVFSEASIGNEQSDKTYLLQAPGTVTGKTRQDKTSTLKVKPAVPFGQFDFHTPENQYKYVGENNKFRQFGQRAGQNNPWYQDFNRGIPFNPNPARPHPITNPWQLQNMPPLYDLQGDDQQSFSTGSRMTPFVSGEYPSADRYYPDFPESIYRDSNPASYPLPHKNGFMPGIGGDNLNFPFSPFGMF